MRAVGGRSKKLRVAFHFQFSNPTGWRCDECRKNGLEVRRRCGWLAGRDKAERTAQAAETSCASRATDGRRAIWARASVATEMCPKSYISGESRAWLEEFQVRKRLGYPDPRTMGAREAHAMLILEQEHLSEVKRGQR